VQGIPGYEENAQAIAARELKTCCDEVYEDRMGNVIGVKKATFPVSTERPLRVMYCAHNDEQGFQVTEVTPEGYVRLQGQGAPNRMSLTGQQIKIEGTEPVYGVIVPCDADAKEFPKIEEMLVVTGCDPEWVAERVKFGDQATVNVSLTSFNNDMICGRNFDDRLGVFCMIEAMKMVSDLGVDLYAVASVQEEIGTRGAMVASQAILPDIGIAVDGGCVVSPMHAKKDGWTSELGKGAAIYQAERLTMCSKRLNAFLREIAVREQIPHHDNWWGGTDAHQIQKQGKGAHVTTVGVPTAFMHWANGLADTGDVQAVTDLLAAFAGVAHQMDVSPDPWTKLS
jgi:tetrahedral aminopeptidase